MAIALRKYDKELTKHLKMPHEFGRTVDNEEKHPLFTLFEFEELRYFFKGLEWPNNNDCEESRDCGFIGVIIAAHLKEYLGY